MKTKEEIIEILEFQIRETEIAYIKTQDVLAEVLEYVRSSKDEWAEMATQFNDPNERALHDPTYEGYIGKKESEAQDAECR